MNEIEYLIHIDGNLYNDKNQSLYLGISGNKFFNL